VLGELKRRALGVLVETKVQRIQGAHALEWSTGTRGSSSAGEQAAKAEGAKFAALAYTGMEIQLITYRGRVVAAYTPRRVLFCEDIEVRGGDDSVKRFVGTSPAASSRNRTTVATVL
jgi:hypothetical protein